MTEKNTICNLIFTFDLDLIFFFGLRTSKTNFEDGHIDIGCVELNRYFGFFLFIRDFPFWISLGIRILLFIFKNEILNTVSNSLAATCSRVYTANITTKSIKHLINFRWHLKKIFWRTDERCNTIPISLISVVQWEDLNKKFLGYGFSTDCHYVERNTVYTLRSPSPYKVKENWSLKIILVYN